MKTKIELTKKQIQHNNDNEGTKLEFPPWLSFFINSKIIVIMKKPQLIKLMVFRAWNHQKTHGHIDFMLINCLIVIYH